MRHLLLGIVFTLAAGPALAETTTPLFVIERSINKNVVHYEAQLTKDGRLDPQAPVIAYWVMLAEDGHREELNWLERTKAYGFRILPGPQPGTYRMTLAAYAERPITVSQDGDAWKAEMVIAGRPAILQKVFIDAVEVLGVPKVHAIVLTGRDLQTKQPLSERIVPQ